jgi:hypothetical protein
MAHGTVQDQGDDPTVHDSRVTFKSFVAPERGGDASIGSRDEL